MTGNEDMTMIKQRWFCLLGMYSLERKRDNRPVPWCECLSLSQPDKRSYIGHPGAI